MDKAINILSPEHSEAVQRRLFELGYGWGGGVGKNVRYTEKAKLWFDDTDRRPELSICYSVAGYQNGDLPFEVVTLDDLYLDGAAPAKSIQVKLIETNGDESGYSASISKDGMAVGCQSFPLSIIDELVKARDEVTK